MSIIGNIILVQTAKESLPFSCSVATGINTQIIRILNIIIARVMNTKYTQVSGMIIELVVNIYTTSINNNYKLSNIL